MSSLDERIRRAFDTPPPVTIVEIRSRAQSTRRRFVWRHRGSVALLGVCAIVICAGIVFVASRQANIGVRVSTSHPVNPPSGHLPTTNKSSMKPTLTLKLALNRTVAGADGRPIEGFIEVRNTTRHPIVIEGACHAAATNTWIKIGLRNAQVPYTATWILPSCTPYASFPPGVSTYPIDVPTTWYQCGSGSPTPPCSRSGLPPLPPGRYVTTVRTSGLPGRTELPPSIHVTLMRPR
jgi:hypothetical protein